MVIATLSHKKPKNSLLQRGFTLIELLIVISIIGVLSGLLFANYGEIRVRGRDSSRKSDLAQVKNALRLYYNDHQTYPGTCCSWGNVFSVSGTTYMSELPVDPINTSPYTYGYQLRNGGEGFWLTAVLENSGDPEIDESQERCGASGVVDPQVYVVCAE